jgi:hypothetical protein
MREVSHYIHAPFRLPRAGDPVSLPVDTSRGYNTLSSPVVLVTKGRGREVFKSSRLLFARIEEIARTGEEVIQINNNVYSVHPAGIAALNTMLATCGLDRFRIAARRQTGPARTLNSRFQWAFLADYLGWEWKALK